MAKFIKPSIADGISFAFELYKRIPTARKVTAQELKAQLDEVGLKRDIRTIQRNLDVIVRYFDIEKDTRDKPYGYSRRSNIKRTLGAREAMILAIAEVQLKHALPDELQSAIESTFTETRINFLPTDEKNEISLPSKVVLDSDIDEVPKMSTTSDLFERLCIALYHNRWVNLSSNMNSQNTPVETKPLGLILSGTQLLLVHQEKGSDAIKEIPLDRITQFRVSTYAFEYPRKFEFRKYAVKEQNALLRTKLIKAHCSSLN